MSAKFTNLNSVFLDSAVSSPTEHHELTEDPKTGGLSYISVYSTVMVFNPDFNFGGANVVKRSSSGTLNSGTFTSWFESDSDGASPLISKAPLTSIEEIPLSPKSKPLASSDPKNNARQSTDRNVKNKVSSGTDGSRIGANAPRPKSNRKVNPKKQSVQQIKAVEPIAASRSSRRLDQQRLLEANAQNNSILLSPDVDDEEAGICRSRQRSSGGRSVQDSDVQKSILNSAASPYSSSNSSSSTIKPAGSPIPLPVVEAPSTSTTANPRVFRPKLQLQTAGTGNPVTGTLSIFPSSKGRRDSKEQGLTVSKNSRVPTSHSAVSRSSSPEQDNFRRSETPRPARAATKLPLQSLLLSPLGAATRSRSISRGRRPSISTLFSNSSSTGLHSKSNSIARSSSVSGLPSQETNEESKPEAPDMVSNGQLVGLAKEHQPSGSARGVSRFRRFSLAYLSGSEHDYDGGSEQSSRSPLKSWKTWSNRSSIASFSSASNRHSRGRYSAASISTSQGSSSSSMSSSGLDHHHHFHPETGGPIMDDRRRTSVSGSSVAELSWKQVPHQTYAHLMSSRRNSVATTTSHWRYSQTFTQTFTTTSAKAPSPNLTATTSRSSDASSVHSLVERVYSANPTPATEKEDPFTAFYMATKPKTSPLEIQAEEIRAYEKQKREEKMLARIANGSFFDSDDSDDDEEVSEKEVGDEDEDLFNQSGAHDWWMSGIEEVPEDDEDWQMPRVPSLEFDGPPKRVSSISTGTTMTTDDLNPSTPTAAEIAHYRKITEMAMSSPPEKRRRRRTASSECLIVDAAEGLRTMYIEDPSDEYAVEEEDNVLGTKTPVAVGELPLVPVKPLSLPPMAERASRRSISSSLKV